MSLKKIFEQIQLNWEEDFLIDAKKGEYTKMMQLADTLLEREGEIMKLLMTIRQVRYKTIFINIEKIHEKGNSTFFRLSQPVTKKKINIMLNRLIQFGKENPDFAMIEKTILSRFEPPEVFYDLTKFGQDILRNLLREKCEEFGFKHTLKDEIGIEKMILDLCPEMAGDKYKFGAAKQFVMEEILGVDDY